MKVKFLLLIASVLSFATAFAEEAAEGAHHEPSIMDLKYPFINFVVLVGFCVWKFRKPLSEMFDKKSAEVKSKMESADKQSKDANAKLAELESKLKNIDAETTKISNDYATDIASFSKNIATETETTMARMRRDVDNKLAGEKKELMDGLSHELLDLVVNKTQTTIKSNNDLKSKATNNIFAGIK